MSLFLLLMRASAGYILSESGREVSMATTTDWTCQSHDHGSLLILIRGIGANKPKSLKGVFQRIQQVQNVKVNGK